MPAAGNGSFWGGVVEFFIFGGFLSRFGMAAAGREALSQDELRKRLYQAFKKRGVLDTLKVRLIPLPPAKPARSKRPRPSPHARCWCYGIVRNSLCFLFARNACFLNTSAFR